MSDITIVNPLEVPVGQPYRTHNLFVFAFGAYGSTKCAVWAPAGHVEDALEEAAGWLADHAPGHFSEPDYADAAKELGLDWSVVQEDPELFSQVVDAAETDHTYTESGWLLSWEWTVDELTDGPTHTKLRRDCLEQWWAEYEPDQSEVSADLARIPRWLDKECHVEGCDDPECPGCTDVRLQVDSSGGWTVHDGQACYDIDHRGYWAAGTLRIGDDFDELARTLIDQARESFFEVES